MLDLGENILFNKILWKTILAFTWNNLKEYQNHDSTPRTVKNSVVFEGLCDVGMSFSAVFYVKLIMSNKKICEKKEFKPEY